MKIFYALMILVALICSTQVDQVTAQDSAVQVISQAVAQATIAPSIFLLNPRDGQALQGFEIIEGKIRGDGFIAGKISFRYAAEGQETWFYIADINPEAEDSSQTSFKVEWDTSQITDGNYHLRVVAEYEDSPKIFEGIQNLRIRNHSPVETSTPAPEFTQGVSAASLTPTILSTPAPTSTPLPRNPAEIRTSDLNRVLITSAVVILGAFLIGGVYSLIRKKIS